MTPFEEAVADVLAGLGVGDVVTYGEVAAEAGYPGAARAVGRFLATREGQPWWRVVTGTGRLVPQHDRGACPPAAGRGCPGRGRTGNTALMAIYDHPIHRSTAATPTSPTTRTRWPSS